MPSFLASATLAAALAATAVQGHMEMQFPAPLRSKFNSFATTKDSDMTAPLSTSGANFPCKGYLSDLGTPAGQSVLTLAPGQKSNFTIVGGAAHNGGSCQASLSYDKGKTFVVVKSIIGDCPVTGGSSFDWTVPEDAPQGDAVFSWSWSNKVGNAEFYQNCASITIGAPKNKIRGMPRPRAPAVAFSARPPMFVSNVGNGCKTEGIVVDYPNPGPDVQRNSAGTAPSCDGGAGKGAGGGGGGAGSSPAPSNGAGSGQPSAAPSNGAGAGQPSAAPSNGAGAGKPSAAPSNGAGAGQSSAAPSNGGGAPATKPASTSAPASAAPVKPSATSGPGAPSVPGGVFVTASPSGGDSAAPTPSPSGDKGATPSAPSASPAPTPSAAPSAVPSAAPSAGPAPGNGGGGASAGQLSGKCDEEGAYNCIGGTSFQRCASGSWSVPIPMAPGTTCTAGKSSNLAVAKH